MVMKSFLFAIVAVLLSLNVFGQTLRVDGDPFASGSICTGCSTDNNGKRLSRIVITSNMSIDELDVKGAIIVSKNDDIKFGRKIIDFMPNKGQKITFYAAKCKPLEVKLPESVSRGTEYNMYIIFENNGVPIESVVTPIPTSIGGHEYVDLGLPSGTLWATCNIGASAPEEYGNYFAWGETTTKKKYTWSTLKYAECDDTQYVYSWSVKYSKYNFYSELGIEDDKTTLERTDDAATANWGSDWCMPTYAQFLELEDECIWTWTTQNGKNGYVVKGPNDKSIFFPASGYYDDTDLNDVGSMGYYWSSSLGTPAATMNYSLCMNFSSDRVFYREGEDRYKGFSVRPVRSR